MIKKPLRIKTQGVFYYITIKQKNSNMLKIKDIENRLQGNEKYFFNAARVEYKNSYKLIVSTQSGIHRLAIEKEGGVITYIPQFFNKTIKGLYEMVDLTISFAKMQTGSPVLEDGFNWVAPNTAIERYLRYSPEKGILKGEILNTPFYIKTGTPVEWFGEDELEYIVEDIAKRIFEVKMQYTNSGELNVCLQTTKSNLANPSDNDIVEQSGEDIVYVEFTGRFY